MPKHKGPLVSIMMPSYQHVGYIKWAIDIVKAQTHTNWELLICDDASNDGSPELLSVLGKTDKRIKVFNNKQNLGIKHVRRMLASVAEGEFLCHLDSDDMLERWAIEEMLLEFEKYPEVKLIFSDMVQVGRFNAVEIYKANKDFDSAKLHEHGWRHFGMYRTDVFNHIYGFNELCRSGCEDGDFFMQIAEKFPIRRLPKVLYKYRSHGNNTSSNKPKCEECEHNPDCNYIRVWAKSLNYDQRTLKPIAT